MFNLTLISTFAATITVIMFLRKIYDYYNSLELIFIGAENHLSTEKINLIVDCYDYGGSEYYLLFKIKNSEKIKWKIDIKKFKFIGKLKGYFQYESSKKWQLKFKNSLSENETYLIAMNANCIGKTAITFKYLFIKKQVKIKIYYDNSNHLPGIYCDGLNLRRKLVLNYS